jgi:hypothetical protein
MKVNVLSRVGLTAAKDQTVEELGESKKFGKLLLLKNEDGYFAKFTKNPRMFEILTIQDSPNDVVEDIVEFFITEVEEGDDKDLEGFMNFFKNFKKGNGKFGKILFTELDEFAEKYEGDVESSTKPSRADSKDSIKTFAYSPYKVYDIIHDGKSGKGAFYVTDYDFDYERALTPGEAIWKFVEEQLSDTNIKTLKRMIRPKGNEYGELYSDTLKEFERKGK